MASLSTQCLDCALFRGLGECAAFPNGIPSDIFSGEFDHEQPHPGDDGKRFVQATSTDADLHYAYPEVYGPPTN